MKRTIINVLLLLMLSAALIVSCSQNAGENAAVGEELVDISFSTMTSRALTATREAFDESKYVWMYKAVKDDNTGLTHGQTTDAKYVVDEYTAGLTGKTITDLSQGYWNFTLYAYKVLATDDDGKVTEKSDDCSFKGTVTHQKVVKGELATVKVTVSPTTEGKGSISFSASIVLDTLDGPEYASFSGDVRMGFGVKKYGTDTPIDSSEWDELDAGTYIVTVQVYYKDDPGIVFATESKIVTVYTGLNTEIGGSVGELSAGIQFGEVTAEIIEATSPVIDKDTSGDVEFQSSSTIPVTASLPGSTAVALLDIEEGKTKEMTLTLEIQSEEATVTEQQTSKVYDISLMQTTVTKDNSTGAVSSDVGIIKNLSDSTEKLADYYLTATLAIDKNLESVTVKHSGMLMRSFSGETPNYNLDSKATVAGETFWKGFYKYEPSTGILTIVTRSFSPFEVFYTEPTVVTYPVAVYDANGNLVGGFDTMKAAVDSAVSGQTVKLLADVQISAEATAKTDRIVISEDITIDFGAYKLIAPGALEPTGNWAALFITGNVVFEATTGGIDCLDNVSDCGPYCVNVDGGTLTVNGGVYHGGGTAFQVKTGKLFINGGTFSVTPFDEPYGYYFLINCIDDAFVSGDATVEIKGGTFYRFNPADAHGEPTDPTSYLAEGYLASYDSSKQCYTVMSADGVIAQIGETYYTSFSKAVSAAKTGETIEILKDFTIDTPYSDRYAANELRKGVTLDGNDHIISLRFSDSEQILLKYLEGSIKNLTVDFGDIEEGSFAFYAGCDDYAIEFKDVTATGSMSHFDGNCGVFVIYGCTNMTLDGCVSYVDIDGIGTEGDYDGVFVGYAYAYTNDRKYNRTFTFKDCINYGTVSCGHVGLLVGSMVYSGFNVVATDCYNYGTITEMYTDYTAPNPHYPNIVYGATSDHPWSTKINGVSYTKAEILAGAVDAVMNKGTYGVGSSSSLTISSNTDGSFEITGYEGAAYYVVNYGLYTTLKSGGSTRNYVSERLDAPGTTQLKAYSFVDTSWAEANPAATSAPVVYGENTYTVYTLGDDSYYLINNNDRETLNGQVRPATLISVSAYSSTGKLLAAAGLGSSSTVQ